MDQTLKDIVNSSGWLHYTTKELMPKNYVDARAAPTKTLNAIRQVVSSSAVAA